MSKSYKDLKSEYNTMAECLQASESMDFIRCSEVRDATVAVMQVKLGGMFHNVVCTRDDLSEIQDAAKSMTNSPEKQAYYQKELYIAHKDLMGHEMHRRG